MSESAYIAIGSNLGDRRATIESALNALRDSGRVRVVQVSTFLETAPVGGPPDQGNYLNGAAELETDLSPEGLLELLLETERQYGRVRTIQNAPRTLDLDLILFGNLVRVRSDPIVPHPRMHERLFVLEPLAEIAANVVHPEFGISVESLRRRAIGTRWLDGVIALVTGSTSGIGRAIAETLARHGAWIIIHGRREIVAADLADQIRRHHQVATSHVVADLRDSDSCDRLADITWQRLRGLNALICNAGADTLTGDAARWTFERKLEELWAVDVRATIRLCRNLGSRMREAGSGVIVTMGWDQAETGMDGDSGQLFAASKGAVMAFTKSLAVDLAPRVRVNAVAPGWIRTAWGENASDHWQQRAIKESLLKRWGTPQDVADTTAWLVSPAASFVTGQIIRVNGGMARS
jgi:2-amino-4-hydroxy-6-hydroxymethyldihydropteridine diphosphokinase